MTKRIINAILHDIPHRSITVKAKDVLLIAGSIANSIFFVKSGCLRAWYNANEKDITLQFFMPKQPVASFNSFINSTPSEYTIEAVMLSEIYIINGDEFRVWLENHPEYHIEWIRFAVSRLAAYQNLFLSRIKDTPQQRYETLLREHPEIVAQIPQHYIASYLGITPVSLSRIRARTSKS